MRRHGFSLVEIAIVLVILGLLVGGIVAGKSIIQASQVRKITADFVRYNTAVRAFDTQYGGYPGDLPRATEYWGFAGGTTGQDAACYNVSSKAKGTCNGDGDGNIACANPAGTWSCSETFHAWKQLANAGLIEGSYTGVKGVGGTDYMIVPGFNAPGSSRAGTGFAFWSQQDGFVGDGNCFPGKGGNLIMFGTANTSITEYPGLRPTEAWNIDLKMDDGKPGLGNMRSHRQGSASPNCANSTDPNIATYRTELKSIECNLYQYIN